MSSSSTSKRSYTGQRENNHSNRKKFYCEQIRTKFIGGAEQARRNAKKRRYQQRSNSSSSNSFSSCPCPPPIRLPKSMKPSERFFASLLSSSVSDLEESNVNEKVRERVMRDICGRIGVPLPAKLPSSYRDAYHFYSTRASLVLEESRCILSDALLQCRQQQQKKSRYSKQTTPSMQMKLVSLQESKKSNHVTLHLKKTITSNSLQAAISSNCNELSQNPTFFTPKELYNMKPGCCFKITAISDGGATNYDKNMNKLSLLASVVPRRNLNGDNDDLLSLMIFQTENLLPSINTNNTIWEVTPLTSLISQMRQVEACTTRATKVDFLPSLLAWKERTHIRFDDSSDDDSGEEKKMEVEDELVNTHVCFDLKDKDDDDDDSKTEESNDDISVESSSSSSDEENEPLFLLPKLNSTQEEAATKFINSPPSTLTLVQGPPGTGKTTFLVSTLCRCLHNPTNHMLEEDACISHNRKRRILVTAPTNKAITVLATRFLDALNGNENFNVVMIGVEDKLVENDSDVSLNNVDGDPFDTSPLSPSLRSIFVYTWIQSISQTFQKIFQNELQRNGENFVPKAMSLMDKTIRLKRKLHRSIPYLYRRCGALNLTEQLITCIKNAISCARSADDKTDVDGLDHHLEESKQCLNLLIKSMDEINLEDATQELLATANVIFCTLSSAGVVAMKQTRRVDDLFVDEAAAATEPEICIPFHLRPSRMLAVGDPMQLPATIMSRHAINFGLDKSLHERLMYDCGKEYVMLDVQYRMKPEISKFPSGYFYGGKLLNGGNVSTNYHARLSLLDGAPYSFLQVDGAEQQLYGASYSNEEEARVVVDLVKCLSHKFSKGKYPMTKPWDSADSIRIITFYQGQVAVIRRLLHQVGLGRVLVATVDSSQGCEADIVIVSFVRSNKKQGNVRRTAGFLTDNRRMNVALTRARYQLVCIGDARGTLVHSGDDTLKAIVDDAESRQCIPPSTRI